jgi:hypothetical protein
MSGRTIPQTVTVPNAIRSHARSRLRALTRGTRGRQATSTYGSGCPRATWTVRLVRRLSQFVDADPASGRTSPGKSATFRRVASNTTRLCGVVEPAASIAATRPVRFRATWSKSPRVLDIADELVPAASR